MTGLYHARQARGMSRSELVRLSGDSKQQLSRLENGLIRLRLDHLKPFAGPLGYTPACPRVITRDLRDVGRIIPSMSFALSSNIYLRKTTLY